MTVLITDPIDLKSVEFLKSDGFAVDYQPGLAPDKIRQTIGDADALIVRSGTKVSAEILSEGKNLKVVGRAGAGVDNIDVEAATRRGIIVLNTPGGNTISTAEHTISLMLALVRNVPSAAQSLREGKWERKAFIGIELHGKTLGIIGLGKVGTEVARRCVAFGMHVIAYDPVLSSEYASRLGAQLVKLDDIFRRSDIISVHTPLTAETRNLIGEKSLSLCKRGVRIINCARGGIVDERALHAALESGQVAGAALDVFEAEPPKDFTLLRHPHVVATPHLGASTEEALEKVSLQIVRQVADVLMERGIRGAVNGDIIGIAMQAELKPLIELSEMLGRLLAQLMRGNLKSITVGMSGTLYRDSLNVMGAAVLRGMLSKVLSEPVNLLNAPLIARERGINLHLHQDDDHDVYSNVLTVAYETDREKKRFSGTVFGNKDVRIIGIDSFHFEIRPAGNLLFYSNIDRPGILAAVGGVLAKSGINIGGLSLGRYGPGQQALTVVSVDSAISERTLKEIALLDGVTDVRNAEL